MAEFDERAGLVLQPGCQIGVQYTLFIVKKIGRTAGMNTRLENCSVAIAKNLLKMFDGASSELPDAILHNILASSKLSGKGRRSIKFAFRSCCHCTRGYDHQNDEFSMS